MITVCTISTQSHLFKSNALADSLEKFGYALQILVVDGKDKNLLDEPDFHTIYKKYKHNSDKLRWALKPIYVKYLLNNGFDRVIYVDNDVFFYSSPEFLFEKLLKSDFLLTPHFYKANPEKEQNWLEANFRIGLYNAGFFGATKNAIPILEWWTNCCLYNIKKSYWRGLFDDQKYLDLIPVLFENVEVIKNRGCNFAGWNSDEVKIERNIENQVIINGEKLVFIHFAGLSIQRFSQPDSPLFTEYAVYLKALQSKKSDFQFRSKKWSKLSVSTYFYYFRWKIVRFFEQK